ncbi:MAG: adenylosuccinate synthase [Candidatus Neomarinimicrobiota bacterium]|nr:adenylosuccinate synthase [Candidatus Neomarinimicrobiota bacterium]|tara:strand:- start:3593 stop:4864 length:1272 start_codon:yes stop_codon:yes gene_type:complete
MSITAVIGGQWGDEGKGKIVDLLSKEANMVARFQGGANAGHTVYKGDHKIILHQIPSGILTDNCKCVLGNGMVIDPVDLVKELTMLKKNNIDYDGSIHIAANAHIVTPVHKWIDFKSEENSNQKIGTTCRGIGPAYVDKYNRCGIRALDLIDLEKLKIKVLNRLDAAIISGDLSDADKNEIIVEIEKFIEDSSAISHMVKDTFSMVHEMVNERKNILLEGAQGTMLDINHGTYPFVTSSSPSTGGIATGLGLPLTKVNRIVGIFKAYTTRVGKGPFPTELFNDDGKKLQKLGHEYGATTGRARRCGWFDAVEAKYSVQINGFTEITLTKLDILDHFEEIKVCVGYEYGGEKTDRMSKLISDLSNVTPNYMTFEGWNQSTTDMDSYEKLPEKTRNYIEFISDFIGVPIKIISIGPGRDEIIHIN